MKLEALREAYPSAEVELWAEDERGRGSAGPQAGDEEGVGSGGRETRGPLQEGLQVDLPLRLLVHPQSSGRVFWLILPTVNAELFSLALEEFAREVGAGESKHVLLVVDKAGWHTGGEVRLPEGIHLEFLPSGSPELQPAERLWPLSNEAFWPTGSLRR